MSEIDVLIVGAGPTGLNLALRLARYGIAFRIIDAADGPGTASRAMAVHARTLEFYRQLGVAEDVVSQGIPIEAMHLRKAGAAIATLSFRDIGTTLSPYPFVMSYPQDDHERFLVARLADAGVSIEWGTSILRFTQTPTEVRAVLSKRGTDDEDCTARFLCGCDGAHSRVREHLDLGFPGGTYPNRFYVVDAKLAEDVTSDGTMAFGPESFALKLPVRSREVHRLIGLVPPGLADREALAFEDLRADAERLLQAKVERVNWFSAYRSHHRVAARFRVGRCFIAGDAGHVHSPAGGQGMNTGIGDAVNLAWKLAAVIRGRADASILDTYETERIAFARRLVASTDRAFRVPIKTGLSGHLLRTIALPTVVPALFRFAALRRRIFKTISQTQIHYRDSALSGGRAGSLAGGDRLPWVARAGADNFVPLASLDWQVHVYGLARAPLRQGAERLGLALRQMVWGDGAAEAGFRRDAAYLVRPDGYIGLVLPDQETKLLNAYVARHGLRFPSAAVPPRTEATSDGGRRPAGP